MSRELCGGCEVFWMYDNQFPLPVQALHAESLCNPCAIIEEDDQRRGDGLTEIEVALPDQSFRISSAEDFDKPPEDLSNSERISYEVQQGGGIIYPATNFQEGR